jgi:hypothetical protein
MYVRLGIAGDGLKPVMMQKLLGIRTKVRNAWAVLYR